MKYVWVILAGGADQVQLEDTLISGSPALSHGLFGAFEPDPLYLTTDVDQFRLKFFILGVKLVVIGRKQGDKIDTLAEPHGVVEGIIINWLDRFEDEPTQQAPYDDPHSGRTSKIDEVERE